MQNLSLEIVQPMALFGLLLLPLFVLLNRFSRSHLAAHRRRLALLVRLVVVALLVFAASGPRLVQAADRLATAFLLDFSDSVSANVREQAVTFVRQALVAKRDGDQAVVIAFGEHAQVDQPLGSFKEISGVNSVVSGGHTNIAEAIRTRAGVLTDRSSAPDRAALGWQ